jgi:hypothetical protein
MVVSVDAFKLWVDRLWRIGLSALSVYSPDFSNHNTYLQRLVETGPSGLVATVGLFGYFGDVCVPRRRGCCFVAGLSLVVLVRVRHDLMHRFQLEVIVPTLVAIAALEFEFSNAPNR